MLTTEQQLAELDRVVVMCKGTKLEGKEALCVKWWSVSKGGYCNYRNMWGNLYESADSLKCYIKATNKPPIVFAVAIVEDTPIFLEEPFDLAHKQYGGKFIYNAGNNRLETVKPLNQAHFGLSVSIPIKNIIWSEFRLYKSEGHSTPEGINYRQIGGNHYKDKAIQPWAYMEANYPKEQFIGFL